MYNMYNVCTHMQTECYFKEAMKQVGLPYVACGFIPSQWNPKFMFTIPMQFINNGTQVVTQKREVQSKLQDKIPPLSSYEVFQGLTWTPLETK